MCWSSILLRLLSEWIFPSLRAGSYVWRSTLVILLIHLLLPHPLFSLSCPYLSDLCLLPHRCMLHLLHLFLLAIRLPLLFLLPLLFSLDESLTFHLLSVPLLLPQVLLLPFSLLLLFFSFFGEHLLTEDLLVLQLLFLAVFSLLHSFEGSNFLNRGWGWLLGAAVAGSEVGLTTETWLGV